MTKDVDVVVKLDLGYTPEAAISGAVLVQTERLTFLTFNANKLTEDGFYNSAGTALVEFYSCSITKFGYPNDEAFEGHPLASQMDGSYEIYEVINSSWVTQLEEQNRVSFPNTGKWKCRHFIFAFHDSTFECIADDLKIEILNQPYETVFDRITKRVLSE